MTRYGWLIRHEPSGDYVRIAGVSADGEFTVTLVSDPRDADMFNKRKQASALLDWLAETPFAPFIPETELVELAFYGPIAPDANRPTVQTREEIVTAAIAAGEPRRAAARRARAEAPSTVLISQPPVKSKRVRKSVKLARAKSVRRFHSTKKGTR